MDFSKKIKALITKYGGANSHMTIRCAELDIPAAIGIGDKKFDELLKTKNQIDLDCSTKILIYFDIMILWIVGLSGVGKTTLGKSLYKELKKK